MRDAVLARGRHATTTTAGAVVTRWTDGGATYRVFARPLLPGEVACRSQPR